MRKSWKAKMDGRSSSRSSLGRCGMRSGTAPTSLRKSYVWQIWEGKRPGFWFKGSLPENFLSEVHLQEPPVLGRGFLKNMGPFTRRGGSEDGNRRRNGGNLPPAVTKGSPIQ